MAEKIKISILGTSSAVPTERRNHMGILLTYKENNFLFDCGEGTQRQFRIGKLNPCKVNKIFISHWHGDHALGLPGLLQTMALNGYNGILEIYGPKGTEEKMNEMLNSHMKRYLRWSKEEGNNFEIKVFESSRGTILNNEDFLLNCIETKHGCKSLAFSFTLKARVRIDKEKLEELNLPNGPLLGQLAKGETINHKGKKICGKDLIYSEQEKKFCYISDGAFFGELIDFARNSNVLISESTYSALEEDLAKKHYHLTSKQAAEIAKKSESKSLFITHFSQRYSEIPKLLESEAKEVFPNTKALEDFDVIEF